MAAHIVNSGNHLARTTAIVSGASDFTVMFWFCGLSGTAASNIWVTANGTPGLNSYTKYVEIYNDSFNYNFDVTDGTTDDPNAYFVQGYKVNIWKHITYTRTSGVHTWYINGVLAPSSGTALSLAAAGLNFILLGDDGTADGNTCLYSNYREWSVALTVAQIAAEIASNAAVVNTSGLVAFTPLTANGNDTSGNGHNWTTGGTVTFVADPTFFANALGPASAVAVTAGSTTSQSQQVAAGQAASAFFSYAPVSAESAVSAFAFGTAGVYTPFANWVAPATAVDLGWSQLNKPIYVPVRPTFVGQPMIVEAIPDGTLTTPTLTFQLHSQVNQTAPAGSFAIPSTSVSADGYPWPTALLDEKSTATLALVNPLPVVGAAAAGAASILPDGTLALSNGPNEVDIYSPTYTPLTTTAIPGNIVSIACDNTGTFYVLYGSGGHYLVKALSKAGVLGSTTYDLGTTQVKGIGANTTSTVLYYYTTAVVVKKWDLVNNVSLGNLVGSPATMRGQDFLVLQDNSVVYGTTANSIVRYDGTSGTLLTTITPPNGGTFGLSDRLAIGVTSATIGHYQLPGTQPQFTVEYNTSSGAVLQNEARITVVGGASTGTATATPASFFGPDSTCPMWITRGSSVPAPVFIGTAASLPIRRERTVPIPTATGNVRQTVSRLELQFQPGTGESDDPTVTPQFMVRMSWDSGQTWSNERLMTAGREGGYLTRAFVNVLGSGRYPTVQIATSDPFLPVMTNCFAWVTPGLH